MNIQRFYINTKGNDDEAYREAIKFACELAEKDKEITDVVLLVETKSNVGWFERLFGRETVKKLFGGATFKNCSPMFRIETKKTYKDNYKPSEVVISCGLDVDEVFKVDDFECLKAIIAIPWLENQIQKWVQRWGPKEIRGHEELTMAFPEPSCIVKKALEELTKSINTSTGIINPHDEKLAKTFILALHKYEPSLDADIVGTYLVKVLHWTTEHAQDVEELINTLNSGKHFQGGARTGLRGYYNEWKKECK